MALGLGLAVLVAGSVYLLGSSGTARAPVVSPPARPTVPPASAPPASAPQTVEPPPRELGPSFGPPPPSKPGRPAPRRRDTLAEEVRLISRAQRAVRGSPGRALSLTRRHRARFPRGVLVQEREALAIEALVRLGRRDQARRRADRLYRRSPATGYRLRIEALLQP